MPSIVWKPSIKLDPTPEVSGDAVGSEKVPPKLAVAVAPEPPALVERATVGMDVNPVPGLDTVITATLVPTSLAVEATTPAVVGALPPGGWVSVTAGAVV